MYHVQAVLGDAVYLPCDISTVDHGDAVLLVLWYREDLGTPIYSDHPSTGVCTALSRHVFVLRGDQFVISAFPSLVTGDVNVGRRLLTARYWEPLWVVEVSMERRRNESVGETCDPRENPPINGIVHWQHCGPGLFSAEVPGLSSCFVRGADVKRVSLGVKESLVADTRGASDGH
ncbi:hypothetical protein PR048_024845 [Dryococelus australis]|uniref:Uncharacterized protein n=1 Tax=Dryococelus australis TaxID=614101 RepID=A0ABQ9GPQ0_9NEOP|nr:hypothetical protein PR048_024845 [Dryococelus australis]